VCGILGFLNSAICPHALREVDPLALLVRGENTSSGGSYDLDTCGPNIEFTIPVGRR
jgi:hypothetical protein